MAYSSRFRFDFTSRDGVDCAIDVLGDGYAGTADSRAVGGTVTLRRTKSGNIIGTSLTWAAECAVESEFADLYTSDPKAFKVELYRPGLIWSGYITPELYSEPVVAPPYDVTLTADDRIAELKLNDFEAQGSVSVGNLLAYLLAPSASSKVTYISSLKGGTASLAGIIVNIDHMEGESFYDVLDALLETFNAVIYYDGASQSWTVCRENDAALLTQGKRATVGTLDPTAPTLSDFFPVGNMTAEVVPAKKRCFVAANMGERVKRLETSSWIAGSSSVTVADGKISFYAAGSYAFSLTTAFYFATDYPAPCYILKLSSRTTSARGGGLYMLAKAVFECEDGTDRTRYLNVDGEWQADEPRRGSGYSGGQRTANETPVMELTTYLADGEFEIAMPAELTDDESTGVTYTVVKIRSLTIYLYAGRYNSGVAYVTDVALRRSDNDLPETITTTVVLGNGAREDDECEVELSNILGDPSPVVSSTAQFLNGAGPVSATYTSGAVTSGLSFDDFTAVDHALSVCVPRLRFSGVLHGRATPMSAPPMFIEEYYVAAAQYAMMVEESSYDILEGDLDFTALTFPAASLTYTSLTRNYTYGRSPAAKTYPRSISLRKDRSDYKQWVAGKS
jgi:hypothetical protein